MVRDKEIEKTEMPYASRIRKKDVEDGYGCLL